MHEFFADYWPYLAAVCGVWWFGGQLLRYLVRQLFEYFFKNRPLIEQGSHAQKIADTAKSNCKNFPDAMRFLGESLLRAAAIMQRNAMRFSLYFAGIVVCAIMFWTVAHFEESLQRQREGLASVVETMIFFPGVGFTAVAIIVSLIRQRRRQRRFVNANVAGDGEEHIIDRMRFYSDGSTEYVPFSRDALVTGPRLPVNSPVARIAGNVVELRDGSQFELSPEGTFWTARDAVGGE